MEINAKSSLLINFTQNLNCLNGILRGSEETDSWKKLEAEILMSDSL